MTVAAAKGLVPLGQVAIPLAQIANGNLERRQRMLQELNELKDNLMDLINTNSSVFSDPQPTAAHS